MVQTRESIFDSEVFLKKLFYLSKDKSKRNFDYFSQYWNSPSSSVLTYARTKNSAVLVMVNEFSENQKSRDLFKFDSWGLSIALCDLEKRNFYVCESYNNGSFFDQTKSYVEDRFIFEQGYTMDIVDFLSREKEQIGNLEKEISKIILEVNSPHFILPEQDSLN